MPKGCTISFVVKDALVLDRVVQFLEKYGFSYNFLEERTSKKGDRVYRVVRINSLGFGMLFSELFPNKDISDTIMSDLGESGALSLLAGLFDADGTISGHKSLKLTNERLIRKAAMLCAGVGIPTRLNKYRAGITDNGVRTYTRKDSKESYHDCYELALHEIDVTLPVLDQKKVGRLRKKLL